MPQPYYTIKLTRAVDNRPVNGQSTLRLEPKNYNGLQFMLLSLPMIFTADLEREFGRSTADSAKAIKRG
jgi:hypothetical protein